MKISVVAMSLLGISLTAMSMYVQGDGVILGQTTWTAGNGHDYAIVQFPNETWDSASLDITTTLPGYHLATITSQAEQDFVYQFFLDTTGGGWDWWLGGFQPIDPETDPAEGWEWVTGEPWDYTNWSGGEPNDAGGIEDYLAMESWGAWNDCCTIGPGLVGGGYIAERSSMFVQIDILPNSDINAINLKNKGSIQVAILSSQEFLVFNEVNPDSVKFGPSLAVATRQKIKDVNRDGLPDMMVYFKIGETGIECGDTEATLIGNTYAGFPFEGADAIVTKGCGQ